MIEEGISIKERMKPQLTAHCRTLNPSKISCTVASAQTLPQPWITPKSTQSPTNPLVFTPQQKTHKFKDNKHITTENLKLRPNHQHLWNILL